MIATWALIFAAFLYHPEWTRAWLRLLTHSIETVADQIPAVGRADRGHAQRAWRADLDSDCIRDRTASSDSAIPRLATKAGPQHSPLISEPSRCELARNLACNPRLTKAVAGQDARYTSGIWSWARASEEPRWSMPIPPFPSAHNVRIGRWQLAREAVATRVDLVPLWKLPP
jgi:hypothetical protein